MKADDLRDLVDYNPNTGVFTWRKSRPGCRAGDVCGRISAHGYREIGLFGRLWRANRLAWLYMTGSMPSGVVDHINRDRADNKWSNLRDVTHQQNCWNAPARSAVAGVRWDSARGKWAAQARIGGIKKNLGRYPCFGQAVIAHRNAVRAARGDLAVFV